MVVAMARPQVVGGRTRVAGRGVAIVAAIDQSSSMNAVDFASGGSRISRLEAAKRTMIQFIAGRPDDLLGLVVFANYPDLASPPTLDHSFLTEVTRALRSARADDDGTNLGDAIAWALDALRQAPPRKKGAHPLDRRSKQPGGSRSPPPRPRGGGRPRPRLGVTLHTIALGRADGDLTRRRPAAEDSGPDLALLERLARLGGGQPFVASDSRSLDTVFQQIDRLERSPVRGTVHTRYRETFPALGRPGPRGSSSWTACWWPGGSVDFPESLATGSDGQSERLL
jgi:Ca-activated chloride channel family protein